MRSLKDLLKFYSAPTVESYYRLIINTYKEGNNIHSSELYNSLNKPDQKKFIKYILQMYPAPAEERINLVLHFF